MEIKTVGFVGSGTMGSGIAQITAQAGYRAIVWGRDEAKLQTRIVGIDKFLTKSIEKGKITEDEKKATLSRIVITTDMKEMAKCDLVIETVAEDPELKRKFFAELDEICPEHTLFASGTSSLSIINTASVTKRIDKVLGMHFFNPVPILKLLEIIRSVATSDETINAVKDFGAAIGKTVVVSKDTPGFIPTRLGMVQALEAIRMVEAGVATAEEIDTALKLSYAYPMGPLELTDLVGLDVRLGVADSIYNATKDPKYAAPVLLRSMVTAGWLGRKTGKGFYEYNK
ncbi:3-hydroxyacyl-CoA dehydrogenase family protein [Chloroflexota bacterium]